MLEFIGAYGKITKDSVAGLAGGPLVPRPWQSQLIRHIFARTPDGRRRHRLALVGMGRKNGKTAIMAACALYGLLAEGEGAQVFSCAADRDQARLLFSDAKRMVELNPELLELCRIYRDVIEVRGTGSVYRALSSEAYCVVPETPIEMLDGSRIPIGQVQLGQPTVGADGSGGLVEDVARAVSVRAAASVVSVVTDRGRSVICTPDHPFLVRSRDYSGPDRHEWRRADALCPGDRVVVGLGWPGVGAAMAPGEAWALGAWIGDGCSTKFRFTSEDAEIIGGLDAFLDTLGSGLIQESDHQWRIRGNGKGNHHPAARAWITRHCGAATAGDKRVPDAVMRGTRHDWAGFLAGLMDTDGCVPLPRPYVKWTSASRELLIDCQALLARLGINGSLSSVLARYRGEMRTYYELRVCGVGQMRMLAALLELRHPMKRARLHRYDDQPPRFVYRSWDSDRVVSVTDAGVRETTALSMGSGSHVTGGLVTHNTKEGLSPTLVLYDELHAAPNRDLWDVMTLAQGARIDPILIAPTTAGVRTDVTGRDSIAYTLYQHGKRVATGETIDPSFFMAWWEPDGAAPVMDEGAWREANPGLDDILSKADIAAAAASVPSRTPEAEFRIKRLNQWVNSATAWLPSGAFEGRAVSRKLVPRERIIVGFDGSFNHDCTCLVGCTIDGYLEVLGLWERPADAIEWEVPIDEVDARVREVCRDYEVVEIVADPFRWVREIQEWAAAGLPVLEYPTTSPSRMVPACALFYDAVVVGYLTHSGAASLVRHVNNARVKVDRLGPRIVKEYRGSPRSIDLAVAAVAAYDRATFYASQPPAPKRLQAFLV